MNHLLWIVFLVILIGIYFTFKWLGQTKHINRNGEIFEVICAGRVVDQNGKVKNITYHSDKCELPKEPLWVDGELVTPI
jgi:hypothetical protein